MVILFKSKIIFVWKYIMENHQDDNITVSFLQLLFLDCDFFLLEINWTNTFANKSSF